MANGQWYPPEWPDRIRALAQGTLTPVPPKPAATVMLLRDTDTGPTAHMLRRRTSMAFAGGAYAYPGGGVDPRDDERHIRWAGPTRAWWAQRLDVDETAADALAAASDRDLTPVLARARLEDGEIVLSWPGHDEFTKHIPTGGAPA